MIHFCLSDDIPTQVSCHRWTRAGPPPQLRRCPECGEEWYVWDEGYQLIEVPTSVIAEACSVSNDVNPLLDLPSHLFRIRYLQ